MNNNNPLAEIGLLVLSVAILAAMTVLLIVGKINYIEALNFLIVVAGLFGVNVASKAPSPTQQNQLGQLTSQVLSVLPNVVAATQQPTPPAPVPTDVFTKTQAEALAQDRINQYSAPQVQFIPNLPDAWGEAPPFDTMTKPYVAPPPESMMAHSTQTEIPIPDQATQRVPVPPTS